MGLGGQLNNDGFTTSEIEEGHSDFTISKWGDYKPRVYTEAPWYMPGTGPVRPIAVRVSDVPGLVSDVIWFRNKVKKALGQDAVVDLQPDESIHATVYHPDTFYGWRKNSTGFANESQTPEQRLPMSDEALANELERVREVARRFPGGQVELEVDQLTMTSGGVLLLLLRPPRERECDEPSQIDALRQNFSEAFPSGSAPEKLLHVSLLRLLELPESDFRKSSEAVQEVCNQATGLLRGRRFSVSRLLYVHEQEILTLRGTWHWIPLGTNTTMNSNRPARRDE